jgi:hypothetical protein
MNPIRRTSVLINTNKEKEISWELTAGYQGSVDFYIDWARSGGDWTEVAGPLTDVCSYTDTAQYNWNKDRDLYYRVRFTDSSGANYTGAPAKAGDGLLNKHDWLIYREIMRKECLLLSKYTGMTGEYLRRKHWGVQCTQCLDWDTEEVGNVSCPVCLGTGFVGGYYTAIKMNVSEIKTPTTNKEIKEAFGTVDDKAIVVRALVVAPMPDSMDLWVNTSNNDRYVIRQIVPQASYKGIIISALLQMQKLPYTDVTYEVPVDTSSQEDNVTPGLDNGWRPNLEDNY